jgi:ammonia channel protein AmtB
MEMTILYYIFLTGVTTFILLGILDAIIQLKKPKKEEDANTKANTKRGEE